MRRIPRVLAVAATMALLAAGCGSHARRDPGVAAAIAGSRPLGVGPRFMPPAPAGAVAGCRPALGPRDAVHVELFAAGRIVLIPRGIGVGPDPRLDAGRIVSARCFGPIATLEPTGVVLVRRAARARLGDLFRVWRAPLASDRLLTFGGRRVRAFVGGIPWTGDPAAIPLRRHAQIVLETGPQVPPHRAYAFPPGL